ncbi:MAG: response regulator transcription factor [Oscillospiraceae bacterium]|jgi:DNA-binding response OmpR family regulator|nr:response regulator transcription factor [Oscillospiraceae bacterium]
MTTKIILADDEERWRMVVRDFLRGQGFEVLEAGNGLRAVELLREHPDVALVVLDVMMPEMDGIRACAEIRSFSRVPVMMVTAREDEETEIYGVRSGADMYISKPIKMRAFVERIRSLLRRDGAHETIDLGPIKIEPDSGLVLTDGAPAQLTPMEYKLLLYLARTPNVVKTREEILHAVWNTDFYGDGRSVDTHIKNLRIKLGRCENLVKTVRGRGYMITNQQ